MPSGQYEPIGPGSGSVGSSSIVVNSTPITGGTDKHVLYDNAGAVGEAANFTIVSGNPDVTAGNAYLYAGVNAIIAIPGSDNWFFGQAGNLTLSGTGNTAFGGSALGSLTSGQNNVAMGFTALGSCTQGSNNFGLGQNAGNSLTTGGSNVLIGGNAGANVNDNGNVAVGAFALNQSAAGGASVAIGDAAMELASGTGCIAIGLEALFGCSGGSNVAIGSTAGFGVAAGDSNTFIGTQSGFSVTTGRANSILGRAVGSAAIANCIILSDGDANNRMDYNLTNANAWTASSTIFVAGDLYTNDASFLIRASTSLNNAASTNTGTLTNAPAVGNPTKWIAIDDGGVTRHIPAW